LMAAILIASSRVIYVSIPAWIGMLKRYSWFRQPRMVWLPIPATIPCTEDKAAVAKIRDHLTARDHAKFVVGHFGTYGDLIASDLSTVLIELLPKRADLLAVCLGAHGDRFVTQLVRSRPQLSDRVIAPGILTQEDVSLYLQACDLVIQPYPDGASSRRTSLMAAISNGTPAITTYGKLSETIWKEACVVPLVPAHDTEGLTKLALKLLGDASLRKLIGESGKDFYLENFSLSRTLQVLLDGVNEGREA